MNIALNQGSRNLSLWSRSSSVGRRISFLERHRGKWKFPTVEGNHHHALAPLSGHKRSVPGFLDFMLKLASASSSKNPTQLKNVKSLQKQLLLLEYLGGAVGFGQQNSWNTFLMSFSNRTSSVETRFTSVLSSLQLVLS